MTNEEFEQKFDNNEFYDEYAEYIMNNCAGDRAIGNGEMLIRACEDGYLFESFRDSKVDL